MTDEQVTKYVSRSFASHIVYNTVRFVDRYIPGYEFFGKGVTIGGTMEGLPPWNGKGLQITIDQYRDVIDTKEF